MMETSGHDRSWCCFFRCEDGGVTPFMLMIFVVLVLIGGVAVDPVNAWRHKERLERVADVAAHAGAVAFAQGGSEAEVRAAAIEFVNLNLPESYGRVIDDPESDVALLHYDFDAGALIQPEPDAPANAVAVLLRRDHVVDNPVQLFYWRLLSAFSSNEDTLEAWEVRGNAIVVADGPRRCKSNDVIHAGGTVHLTAQKVIGGGVCVHSQDHVKMGSNNEFKPGSGLSMPDLALCGKKCEPGTNNTGADKAAFEANMPVPDIAGEMAVLRAELLSENLTGRAGAFFADRPIDYDLSALDTIGYETGGLYTGSVVQLHVADFNSLPRIPEGLVYEVSCSGAFPQLAGLSSISLSETAFLKSNGKGKDKDKDKDKDKEDNDTGGSGDEGNNNGGSGNNNGGGNNGAKGIVLSSGNAAPMRNVAIATDCDIDFGKDAQMIGSLLVTDGAISAKSHSTVGDPIYPCDLDRRNYVYSSRDMHAPAAFVGSNISFIVDGKIKLASGKPSDEPNRGLGLVASGEIHLSGGHEFEACETASVLHLGPRLIRHVALPPG